MGTGQSDGEVLELTFTADGRNVITTVEDKRALIYETENWEKVGFMNEHQSKIHAIAVSPDGKKLTQRTVCWPEALVAWAARCAL